MYKNYKFKIYKIKENFKIKKRYDYNYIKNYLRNNENIIYNYEFYYNRKYKKFFYYSNKKKKYFNFYSILKENNINNELLKDIKYNSLFKVNNLKFIELYINKNFNFIDKYNFMKLNNEYYIINKTLFR